jgi:hypothetical protein
MRHIWKLLGLAALLALTPAVARADDPELTPPKWFQKAQEQLELNLKKSFQDLGREVQDAKDKALNASLGVEALKSENRLLREELNRLKDEVAHMRKRNGSTTQSFYTPPASGVGSILIDNRNASWTATVSINGITYVVPPLSSHRVERVPAGAFTYSVVSTNPFGASAVSVATTSRTLTANTEFPITINPS